MTITMLIIRINYIRYIFVMSFSAFSLYLFLYLIISWPIRLQLRGSCLIVQPLLFIGWAINVTVWARVFVGLACWNRWYKFQAIVTFSFKNFPKFLNRRINWVKLYKGFRKMQHKFVQLIKIGFAPYKNLMFFIVLKQLLSFRDRLIQV